MKLLLRHLLIFFLLINSTTLFSQQTVHIHGVVRNYDNEYFTFEDSHNFPSIKLKINDGIIDTTLTIKRDRYFLYYLNVRSRVFMKANDNINFIIDGNATPPIKFIGTRKAENNLIYSVMSFHNGVSFKFDPEEYRLILDNYMKITHAFIDSLKLLHPEIDNDFIKREKKDLNYYVSAKKSAYNRSINKTKEYVESKSPSFYSGLDTLFVEDESMIDFFRYKNFYLSYTTRLMLKDDPKIFDNKGSVLNSYKKRDEIIKSNLISEYILSRTVSLTYKKSPEQQDTIVDWVNRRFTNKEFISYINNEYNSLLKYRKSKPVKAVEWTATDINKNIINLSDYKGKWIYLDVWATWCSGCYDEIEAIEELKIKYKNIEFVCISTDTDYNKWKKVINKKKYKPIQLIITEESRDIFMKNYIKKGVPSFFVIDPDGNMHYKYPPYPTEKERINKLLSNIE